MKRGTIKLAREHGVPLLFLGLSLYFLAAIVLRKAAGLTREDGVLESLTALFYGGASLLCLRGFVISRGKASRMLCLAWAALFFLFAMEEISWGQRLLELETPAAIAALNLQNETNLHNLSSELANRVFYVFVFAVGTALPVLVPKNTRLNSVVARWRTLLPQQDLAVPVALAFAFVSPEWMAQAPEMGLLLAVTFLGFLLALKNSLSDKGVHFMQISAWHLWVGLTGIAAIQLSLLIFRGSIEHINQPNEVKEFLFSACFLLFSLRLAGVPWLTTGRRHHAQAGGAHPQFQVPE
ncbi:MAG: hypothetical protein HYX93_03525 [Chloroflexi bacterium]|nr:hypothetical protein [Chloroflexota bacterium]